MAVYSTVKAFSLFFTMAMALAIVVIYFPFSPPFAFAQGDANAKQPKAIVPKNVARNYLNAEGIISMKNVFGFDPQGQIMDQPESKVIGSNRILFKCNYDGDCENAELIVCYPSQLDPMRWIHLNEFGSSPIPAKTAQKLDQIMNNPDHPISKACEQIKQEWLNDPKLVKSSAGPDGKEPWHAFLVRRESKKFVITMPFWIDSLNMPYTAYFEVPDSDLGPAQFYMNFGNKENFYPTYIVSGKTSNIVYKKQESKIIDSPANKKLFSLFGKKAGLGLPLGSAVHLWALGLDMLPMKAEGKKSCENMNNDNANFGPTCLRLFTITKPTCQGQICKPNNETERERALQMQDNTICDFIYAEYLTPFDADPDPTEGNRRNNKPDGSLDDAVLMGPGNAQEIFYPLEQLSEFFHGKVEPQAKSFRIMLIAGFDKPNPYVGFTSMTIAVNFTIPKPNCQIISYDAKSLRSIDSNNKPRIHKCDVSSFDQGQPFWIYFFYASTDKKLILNLNCRENITVAQEMPAALDNNIWYDGDLSAYIPVKPNVPQEAFPLDKFDLYVTDVRDKINGEGMMMHKVFVMSCKMVENPSIIRIKLLNLDMEILKLEINKKDDKCHLFVMNEEGIEIKCPKKEIFGIALMTFESDYHYFHMEDESKTIMINKDKASWLQYVQLSGDAHEQTAPVLFPYIVGEYKYKNENVKYIEYLQTVNIYAMALNNELVLRFPCKCMQNNVDDKLGSFEMKINFAENTVQAETFLKKGDKEERTSVDKQSIGNLAAQKGVPIWIKVISFADKIMESDKESRKYQISIDGTHVFDVKNEGSALGTSVTEMLFDGIPSNDFFVFHPIILLPHVTKIENSEKEKKVQIIIRGMLLKSFASEQLSTFEFFLTNGGGNILGRKVTVDDEKDITMSMHFITDSKVFCQDEFVKTTISKCSDKVPEKAFMPGKLFEMKITFTEKQILVTVYSDDKQYKIAQKKITDKYPDAFVITGDLILIEEPLVKELQ